MREDRERAGEVTCDEAEEILRRFNNSHWKIGGKYSGTDVARYSIPADPKRDDDIRLGVFIEQAREWKQKLDAVRGILERTGCSCNCECDSDGHGPECDLCFGCEVAAIVQPKGGG